VENCHAELWAQSPALQPVRDSFAAGQPLFWNRVHNLPGYVYFDHSIHVQKGVGCSTCHGQIDQMPLTFKAESMQMSFCLDCHQDPARYLRPREEVFNMAWQPPANQEQLGRDLMAAYHVQSKISCSTCHRWTARAWNLTIAMPSSARGETPSSSPPSAADERRQPQTVPGVARRIPRAGRQRRLRAAARSDRALRATAP
jgi:cytochrome c peroxidase